MTGEARKPPRMSRLMSIPELASLLGIHDAPGVRRLRRQLLRLERNAGVRFLTRTGGTGANVQYRVSLATLREHHPEFFYRRDEAAEALREHIERFDESIEELAAQLEVLGRETARRLQALQTRVVELETARRATTQNAIDAQKHGQP